MEIYLVRHTTPNIKKGICYGQTDLDVTSDFEKEWKAVHEKLKFDTGTIIYSSPLQRCSKLANTINTNVRIDDRLMELDFGPWEMKAWNDISPKEIKPWMNDFVNTKVPTGESYMDLQERVVDFFNKVVLPSKKDSILISHAGPIRALLAHIKNMPLKDSFSIQLNYGHVLKLEYKDATFAVTKGFHLK